MQAVVNEGNVRHERIVAALVAGNRAVGSSKSYALCVAPDQTYSWYNVVGNSLLQEENPLFMHMDAVTLKPEWERKARDDLPTKFSSDVQARRNFKSPKKHTTPKGVEAGRSKLPLSKAHIVYKTSHIFPSYAYFAGNHGCPTCEAVFDTQKGLTNHARTHAGLEFL